MAVALIESALLVDTVGIKRACPLIVQQAAEFYFGIEPGRPLVGVDRFINDRNSVTRGVGSANTSSSGGTWCSFPPRCGNHGARLISIVRRKNLLDPASIKARSSGVRHFLSLSLVSNILRARSAITEGGTRRRAIDKHRKTIPAAPKQPHADQECVLSRARIHQRSTPVPTLGRLAAVTRFCSFLRPRGGPVLA